MTKKVIARVTTPEERAKARATRLAEEAHINRTIHQIVDEQGSEFVLLCVARAIEYCGLQYSYEPCSRPAEDRANLEITGRELRIAEALRELITREYMSGSLSDSK